MRRLITAALTLLVVGCSKPKPMHEGKSAEDWRAALHDPDGRVRRKAITAVGALKDRASVPDLIAALQDPDAEVRAKAAEALWSLGPAAKDAVASLIPLLKDRSAAVRLNDVIAARLARPPPHPRLRNRPRGRFARRDSGRRQVGRAGPPGAGTRRGLRRGCSHEVGDGAHADV